MFLPLVPVLAILAIVGGAGTLIWYDELPDREKEQANELASHYAWKLYQKSVQELSRQEALMVQRHIRTHFG